MSLLLIVSIVTRLGAIGFGLVWSLVLLRRLRDWRIAFFALALGLMAAREGLTLLGREDYGVLSLISGAGDTPGLLVSVVAAVAVFFLVQIVTERRRSEDELRESERRFRVLFDNSAEAITLLDATGAIIYAGPSNERLWGFPSDEVVARSGFEFIHPDDHERVMKLLTQLLEQPGEGITAQFRLIAKDGSWHDTEVFGRNLLADPSVQALVVNYRDITERKRAEEALKESEDRYRDLIEHSQDLICTHDLDGRILSINPWAAKVLGYEPDVALKMNIRDGLAPEVRHEFDEYIAKIRKEGAAQGLMVTRTRLGEKRLWEYSNTLRTEGVPAPVVRGMAHDITERKRAEEALQESEAKFRALAETTAAAIYIYRGLDLIYVNPTTEAHTGYTRDELLKKSFMEVVHPEFRELVKERALARQRGESVASRYEFKILTKSGETRWVDAAASSIEYEGKPAAIGTSFDITDRKRAEEALRESEAKFRVLAQTAASVILIYQDSKLVYVNPFSAAKSGYSEQELLSMDFWEIMHPDHRDIVRERGMARLRGEGGPSRYDVKILTKSGETRWLDFSASTIEFQGKPSVLGTALDISERKRAEEALHKSQARLQHLLSSSPAIVYSLRVEGDRFIPEWISDSITRLTGYSVTEALRDDWWASHLHPEDRERAVDQRSRVFDNDRRVLEYRFQHRDEGCHWIHDELRVMRDESGKAIEVIGSWSDVTERREAEIALRASEERYRDMVENARDIIYTHDMKGQYTTVNQAVERITGYTREEALKLNLGQVVAPEYIDTARRMLADKLAGEREAGYDLDIIAKDGRRITVAVNTRPVFQDGIPVGVQGIARDVTERKRAEDALRESQAHLQAILDNCPAMIFQKDLGGRYLQVNRQLERTFNLSPEQVIGFTDRDLFPPDLAAAFSATDRTVLEAGHSLEFEETAVYADGPHAYIVHKFPLLDTAGHAYAVGGISTDITERRRADDELRKQKEILQKIIDHIPVMIRFRDGDGRVRLVNQEWQRKIGWTLEEIQKRDHDIFGETYPDADYHQKVLDFIDAATGEWKDFKTRTRDGRVIDTTWANVRLKDGTNIGIGRDITEQKRAEEKLRQQTTQLATLHEIELEISAESDLSRVLQLITRRAGESQNATHCCVYTYDRERFGLVMTASLDSYLIGLRLKPGEGLAGRAVATGEPQAVDEYLSWEGRVRALESTPVGPALAVPLKWQHMVIGAISLAREPGEDAFTPEDAHFLEQIAAEAAIAIHQATLFEEVQEAHSRLQVLSHKLLDVQEAERKRLARELHDQIGQALVAVQISLQASQASYAGTSVSALDDCLTIIDDALQRVHDLSLDLRPSLLDDLGLVAALRWYVDRLASRAGLTRCFDADALVTRLSPEIETASFRIAQEALTNVLRHANARTVWVQIGQSGADFILVVRDDGVGFDVRAAMKRKGPNASLGLQGMQERAIAAGGLVVIKSKQGSGTQVKVSFRLDLVQPS